MNSVCRIAVPVFFIMNGYYLFSPGISIEKCGNYCLRLFKSYIIWSIVYLPIYLWTNQDSNIIIYIKITLFFGGYGHLWYVYSLIVAIWFVVIVLKVLRSSKVIFIFANSLYIVGGIINDFEHNISYSLLTAPIFRHTVFMAIPFLLIGSIYYDLNFDDSKLKKYGIVTVVLFILENLIIYCMDINCGRENNIYFLYATLTFWILCAKCNSLKFQNMHVGGISGKTLRKISGYVYYIQGIPIFFFKTLGLNSVVYFIIVWVSSTVGSLLVIKFIDTIKLKGQIWREK